MQLHDIYHYCNNNRSKKQHLGGPRVRRAVGAQEEARVPAGGRGQHRLAVHLALEDGQAEVVRPQAPLPQRATPLRPREGRWGETAERRQMAGLPKNSAQRRGMPALCGVSREI